MDDFITLKNKNGVWAQFTPYGARWTKMCVPDRYGKIDDVLLGFDHLSDYYSAGEQYHGAIVGRVCGRISNASFSLNGKEYQLKSNDIYGSPIKNHLHGGVVGFHNQMWEVYTEINEAKEESVTFTLFSPDNEEGYPGNLTVKVIYTLTNENSVIMDCQAHTDQDTPINLTNHSFFNLQGSQNRNNILGHTLQINASQIVQCDEELIPTGILENVENTFMDFCKPVSIHEAIQKADEQTQKQNGFSLTYILHERKEKLQEILSLEEPISGRVLTIFSNQPSLQVYTGYLMDGKDRGKGKFLYYPNSGIALEPQGFPDAVNQPTFPSVILKKGEIYHHQTNYCFSVR